MFEISVIIITKNEAINIGDCIDSARMISDDIIVVDSGSTDGTLEIIRSKNVKLIQTLWKGYGFARNTAAENAINDWILAIDADERITHILAKEVKNINLKDNSNLYGFKRQNYFLGKQIRFGNWGRDFTYRLYNKRFINWDLTEVHESLIGDNIMKIRLQNGHIRHYPVRKLSENTVKTEKYARLNAEKYFSTGKKATLVKRFLSPTFDFIRNYLILLGFLDGKEGFIVSYSNARYTYLKYKYLKEMLKNKRIRH